MMLQSLLDTLTWEAQGKRLGLDGAKRKYYYELDQNWIIRSFIAYRPCSPRQCIVLFRRPDAERSSGA
jgi:hypothetical protein